MPAAVGLAKLRAVDLLRRHRAPAINKPDLNNLETLVEPNTQNLSLLVFGRPGEEITGHHSNFGSILCLELSHDMAKMNFYRILAHIELIGDLFVGLSMTNFLDHLHLPFRQQHAVLQRGLLPVTIMDEAAGGNKSPAGFHQAHGFDGNIER